MGFGKRLWDKEGMRTPWGPAQSVCELAPGILVVDTAGHGGVKLDRVQQFRLPAAARREGGWYEEDCDASIPLAFFFHEIDKSDWKCLTLASLKGSLERWNEKALAALIAAGVKFEDDKQPTIPSVTGGNTNG